MRAHRREVGDAAVVADDGPFVSFTDLFIGVIFLLIILVAALMIMQRANIQAARNSNTSASELLHVKSDLAHAKDDVDNLRQIIDINRDELKQNAEQISKLTAELQAAKGDKRNLELIKDLQDKVAKRDQDIQALSDKMKGYVADKKELDAIHALDAEHPPFRLAIAFNVYESDDVDNPALYNPYASVHYIQTERIFKTPNDSCLSNYLYDFDGAKMWSMPKNFVPPTNATNEFRGVSKCSLDAHGVHFDNATGTLDMNRVSADSYDGKIVLKFADGQRIYRRRVYKILGIFDDRYKLN